MPMRWSIALATLMPLLLGLGSLVACQRSEPAATPLSVPADQAAAPTTPAPSAAIPAAPSPPPPPSDALLALLTPAQITELQTLAVPIVAPAAIPPGFAVAQVTTELGNAGPGEKGYRLLYRGPGDRCFVVEYTSGGIGDLPATAYRLPINPPFFPDADYGLNYGPYQDPDLRSQFPESELASDWLVGDQGAYRLAGAAYINSTLTPSPPCQDIDPETAITLIESMTLLTAEIIGDDAVDPKEGP